MKRVICAYLNFMKGQTAPEMKECFTFFNWSAHFCPSLMLIVWDIAFTKSLSVLASERCHYLVA